MTARLWTSALAMVTSVTLSSMLMAQTPQEPLPQGTGTISGVVTRSDAARPVAGAAIRVIRWEGGRGTQSVAAKTDERGRFTLTKLLAGSYQLTATAEGLIALDYGQRSPAEPGKRIELADGQTFSDADIVLLKPSAVEGRLIDEFGDPVPGLTVQVAQVTFVAGKTRLTVAGGANAPRPTDDLGQFRVTNLPPGDYYVLALAGPFAGPSEPAGFGVTYYPGTSNPTEARAVHVAAGQDVRDIAFAMAPATMATISGVTLDGEGKPLPRASVMLIPTTGGDVRATITAPMASGADGSFSFRNVAHGTYVIQAFGRPVGGGNLAKAPFGALPLTVTGNRDDLAVRIKPGATARGHITFEGGTPPVAPDRVTIGAQPVDFVTGPLGGGPPTSITNDDWTFEVQNQIGLRVLRANVGAPGWIVKSITVGGQDVTDTPIDFRAGDVNNIEVILTSRATTLNGAVTDNGEPAREYAVVAFAEDAAKWGFPSRFVTLGRPTPQGGFRIYGLPPAAYLIVALHSVNGTEFQDPAFLQSLRGAATRVVLSDGDTKTVALKMFNR
jgi:hypothetical protein